jgi:hypothetical protein
MRASIAITLAIAAFLAACGASASPATHELRGTLVLSEDLGAQAGINNNGTTVSTSCQGSGGYADIQTGASIVIKDEGGKILATGTLGDGLALDQFNCSFTFQVTSVPDAKFYQVEVSHRGAITYSRADMDKAGWKVQFTLGG